MCPEIEVEVKVPCYDLDELEKRLMKRGARAIDEVTQEDFYLAHPCRDFGKSDEALRIRRSGKEWRLTYKGPKLDGETKTREELEISVDPKVRGILEKVGFEEIMTIRKSRRVLMLDEIEVSLDRVEGLGDFVELEYKGESVEAGRRMIFQTMERLGLEGSERRSYLELLLTRN
jgi:adenylate cyclase class 2